APPRAGLIRRAMRESPRDDRIASHANTVGVRNQDRSFKKSAFLYPGRPGHLTVSVQAECAGVNRIVERVMSARNHRGHAGPYRPFADFKFSFAPDQSGKADFNPGHVRNRVQLSRCAVEGNTEGTRTDPWFGRR